MTWNVRATLKCLLMVFMILTLFLFCKMTGQAATTKVVNVSQGPKTVNDRTFDITGPTAITLQRGIKHSEKYITYVDGNKWSPPDLTIKCSGLKLTGDAEDYSDPDYYYNYCLQANKPGKGYIIFESNYEGSPDEQTNYIIRKKVNITVRSNKSICLDGYIYDYKSWRNEVTVAITNYSSKTVFILPKGAKAVDKKPSKKPKSRAAQMSGKKTVKIKPGRCKYILFKHKGKSPWKNWNQLALMCKCRYGGKNYRLKIIYGHKANNEYYWGEVFVKKGGKWINTAR